MVDVVGLRNQLHESSGYPVVRARETYDNPETEPLDGIGEILTHSQIEEITRWLINNPVWEGREPSREVSAFRVT